VRLLETLLLFNAASSDNETGLTERVRALIRGR
jgi:hypothetical protein